jgi:PAS domain S-box-containing protein
MKRPTIVIVDDSPDVRALIGMQLRLSDSFDVVGEGANGLDAAALANRHQPDLMLLDVSMPVVDGLAALPQVLGCSPDTRVVMYSGFEEAGLADTTRELGAFAFVEKSVPFETLAATLLRAYGSDPASHDPIGSPAEQDDRPELDPVLEEHLERFREIFEDAAIGMATLTLSGRIVRANRSLEQLLQASARDLVGSAFSEIAEVEAAGEALARLDAGETVVQVRHQMRGRGDHYFRSTLSPVVDTKNRPLYLFLQVQDITAQVAAEAELRRTEARFRLLVEAVQDYAIFMLDPTGLISSWNAGAERSKGYAAEEIIGQHFRVFYPPDKREAQHPEFELAEALEHGKYEEEGWRLRKDGSRFWAHVTITAVHDADGELFGFAKVTQDITERLEMLQHKEQAAQELAEANEHLEEANRQLSEVAEQQAEFFNITAHELRGPVSVLSGASSTLASQFDKLDAEDRETLRQAVNRSSDQLRTLLDDLLTAARLQARRLELSFSAVDLSDLVGSVVEAMSPADDALIKITGEAGVVLRADPTRLRQMLENLLANALGHGDPPVVVRIDRVAEDAEIAVTDAGGGVLPTMHGRLFERFATSSSTGTGLGLYLVRELARAHGGDATYRADDQAFVLSLPVAS